jgi:hypothetical protein
MKKKIFDGDKPNGFKFRGTFWANASEETERSLQRAQTLPDRKTSGRLGC